MRLEELFDIADRHNSSIKSYVSAVDVAQAAYRSALADALPDVEAGVSFSYNGNGRVWNRDFTHSMTAKIPHYGNSAHLRVAMPVYTGGAISAGVALSRRGKQMAELDVEAGRADVRMLITRLYLMLHSLDNQARVFDDNITLTGREVELMRARCEQGVVLPNDVTRLELMLEKFTLGRLRVQNQSKIVNHQLSRALGLDTVVTTLTDTAFVTDALPRFTERQWQETASQNAHDLKRATLAIEMSREKERLEHSAMLPKVSLMFEDYFTGPITIDIPAMNKNFNYWYVGVGVSYNLSSLFKDKRKWTQARVATRQAMNDRVVTGEHVDVAVQAAFTDYQTSLATLQSHEKNVQLAADSYEIVRNRYENGLALITDMLDAANEKLDAELKLVDAQIQVIENYYQIKYICGTL